MFAAGLVKTASYFPLLHRKVAFPVAANMANSIEGGELCGVTYQWL
jgi:hypothetical protein